MEEVEVDSYTLQPVNAGLDSDALHIVYVNTKLALRRNLQYDNLRVYASPERRVRLDRMQMQIQCLAAA